MRSLFQQSGVALMIVLASLVLITTLVVEFAFNTHVTYEVAATQRDKLKAYYLAQSALNLLKLELRLEKQLRQQFASVLQQLGGSQAIQGPFCKMMPLSTGLVQGLLSGEMMSGQTTAEEEQGEEKGEGENEKTEKKSEGEEPAGEDLFDFGGDFEGSCDTEERKINLNAFYSNPLDPQQPQQQNPPAQTAYFEQKNLLFALLSQSSFQKYFEGPDEIQKLVNRIADWADTNDRINEAPGVEGGYEDSDYSELPYKPKNGKYATPSELLLIPGMKEKVYRLLAPNVTVFGDDKINLCQAEDELVFAFLDYYSRTTPGAARFQATDEARAQGLLKAIRDVCISPNPQAQQIASVIQSNLGGGNLQALTSRLSTQNRFYTFKAVGESGPAQTTIVQVLDTENANPNLWKTLYFRVE